MIDRLRGLRRPIARIALALVAAAGMTAAARAQEWRAVAMATFDDVWSTVSDTFYDPAFEGVNWRGVRDELRPRAEAATSHEGVREVIREMLGRLGRSHFALMSTSSVAEALPGAAAIDVDLRWLGDDLVITRVTPGSPADRAGLSAGHVVLAIDGRATSAILASAQGATPRARGLDAWRRAYRLLHGADGSAIEMRVKEAGDRQRDVRVPRSIPAGETVQLGYLPPLHVSVEVRALETPSGHPAGLVAFNVWMTKVSAPFAEAVDRFRAVDGLVIDLRGNPGGLAIMMNGLSGHLIAEPVLLGTMKTREMTLEFKVNPRTATDDGRRVAPFSGPVAILVDELTGSASETFAGSLQSLGRARVFGRQTMGQALPASIRRLPNGDVLMHAVGDFVTSTGRRLEGEGVVPDEVVPLSIDALRAGRDEAVEAALRWIDGRRTGWTIAR